MKLHQYPQKISQVQHNILELELQINIYSEQLSFMDCDIEAAIAGDKELRNEQQRKAKRLELKQEPDYLGAATSLKEFKQKYRAEQIKLEFLRGEFSVAKLEYRLRAAEMMAAS